jgi:hypothetical protein
MRFVPELPVTMTTFFFMSDSGISLSTTFPAAALAPLWKLLRIASYADLLEEAPSWTLFTPVSQDGHRGWWEEKNFQVN